MLKYRVAIRDRVEGSFDYWFECAAENEDHALDQAEDACVNDEIVGEVIVVGHAEEQS